MRIRTIIPVIVALGVSAALCAQSPSFSASARFLWKTASARLEVSRALDRSIPSLQRAENEAEAAIDSAFTDLFIQAVSPLVVDSFRTVGGLAASDPGFFSWIQGLARSARKDALFLSPDFAKATAAYGFPFFGDSGIAVPLYPAADSRIPRRLSRAPTMVFTGLVVYAKDPLPEAGGTETAQAVPALFPRLFDEEMNVVFEKGMEKPSALAAWGMVGYADSIEDPAILSRCGRDPLTVVARAVFGANRTDLVISTRAAEQLLCLKENGEIFKEGRVCIVYPEL